MTEYINPNKTHIAYGWDNIQETYNCCGLETSEVKFENYEPSPLDYPTFETSFCVIAQNKLQPLVYLTFKT